MINYTQEKIKNCIDYYHSTYGTEFVLLAGDHQDVPTREVYIDEAYPYDGDLVGCDSYYSNLNNWDSDGDHIYAEDNDDWNLTADVYVGRLSANDISEMKSLVARIINYESNPPVGEWMNSALLAGSMTYFDGDYNSPGDGVLDYPEGDSNRLARSAGLAVAAKPGGTSFNPLLIFGGVGLGKTHLAHAIGVDIKDRYPEKTVLYNSAESPHLKRDNKRCSISCISTGALSLVKITCLPF